MKRYNLKNIMKRAWEIKREDSRNDFGLCLAMAWAEAKSAAADPVDKLIAAGARRWTKGGYDRLYINADALGYEWGYYKTGNVSWATRNGEHISNSQMKRVLDAKTYIDIPTMKVHGTDREMVAEVAEWRDSILG